MKHTDLVKAIALIVVIVLVFSAAMFGLNFYTGPLIEANNAGAVYGPLLAVMPEGASFDGEAQIYAADGSVPTTLTDVPETVTAIYKEAGSMGYAVKTTATSQYSKAPMEITLGVDAEGKIIKVQIDAYNDTEAYDFRAKDPGYLDTYIGKDSALADVGLVAGTTFSSTAFKQGVSDGLNALIANGLIAEGVKGDDQLLTEMIPTVFPGMADPTGNLKAEPIEVDGAVAAYKAVNGSGFAYIVPKGETMVMAITNAAGKCFVYDTEGNYVTDDNPDAVALATAHASANQQDFNAEAQEKFGRMMEGAENMTALELPNFSTVVAAASFNVGDQLYYGFYSKSYGYEDMDVYVIIDAAGAIAKVDAKTVIFEQEYFAYQNPSISSFDPNAYKAGLQGLRDAEDGAVAISGATMTTNSMKQSINDAFEVYAGVEITEPEVLTNE